MWHSKRFNPIGMSSEASEKRIRSIYWIFHEVSYLLTSWDSTDVWNVFFRLIFFYVVRCTLYISHYIILYQHTFFLHRKNAVWNWWWFKMSTLHHVSNLVIIKHTHLFAFKRAKCYSKSSITIYLAASRLAGFDIWAINK